MSTINPQPSWGHIGYQGQGKLLRGEINPGGTLSPLISVCLNYFMFNLRETMRHSTQDNVILNATYILSRVLAGDERRRSDEFGFSGSERRRQPERLQTCYEISQRRKNYGRLFEFKLGNPVVFSGPLSFSLKS